MQPMKIFNHFVLTKFNVRVDYSDSRTALEPEWLNHRFKLFEQFCYPSVVAQSNQNFKWLVFFDSQTPEFFRNKVKEYSEWKNFIPVYVERHTSQVNRATLLSNLTNEVEYLITTRIDNDNAVCRNFVQIIQDNFNRQEVEFINFTYGYAWYNNKIYYFKDPSNPFISLTERINELTIDGFKTVFCGDYTQLSSMGLIKQIKTKPAWLQVVHERNVFNRIRGIRQPIKKLGDSFSINVEGIMMQENLLSYWIDKGFNLLKFTLESAVLSFPKNTRAQLKNFWIILKE